MIIPYNGKSINYDEARKVFEMAEIAQILGKNDYPQSGLTEEELYSYLEQNGALDLRNHVYFELNRAKPPEVEIISGYDLSKHTNQPCIYLLQLIDNYYKFGKSDYIEDRVRHHFTYYKKNFGLNARVVQVWSCQSKEHMDMAENRIKTHATSMRLLTEKYGGRETVFLDSPDEFITFVKLTCDYRYAVSHKLFHGPAYTRPGEYYGGNGYPQFIPPMFMMPYMPMINTYLHQYTNLINAQTNYLREQREFIHTQNYRGPVWPKYEMSSESRFSIENQNVPIEQLSLVGPENEPGQPIITKQQFESLPEVKPENIIEIVSEAPPIPIIEAKTEEKINSGPDINVGPEKPSKYVKCECGDVITIRGLEKHKNAKKHKNWASKLNNQQ